MIRLGVNLDHVATVRQARRTVEPDPVKAAVLAELGGADGITLHLREDRRHIQEHDVRRMQAVIQGSLNLEMAVTPEMLDFACELRPQACCLVPEKREELTTEGGLDLQRAGLADGIARLRDHGIAVSLFIDPTAAAVEAAAALGAPVVVLHVGAWADARLAHHQRPGSADPAAELHRLEQAAAAAASVGVTLHAGHGITYRNVHELLHLPLLAEVNIGHTIIAHSMLVGVERAVREMKLLLQA
jgi:pyridoxine 5-phosphate synthase